MEENLKNLKIGVLMGGKSAEREISLRTGNAVLSALKTSGYNAIGFDLDDSLHSNLKKIDICFVALHGTYGEDGRVQGILDLYGIPYTGSGVCSSAIAMDKLKTRAILDYHGIKTPPFLFAGKKDNFENILEKLKGIEPPYFIKPNSSGSSFGCSIVNSLNEDDLLIGLNNAFEYDDTVLIEKYLNGREIQFAVAFGNPIGCVEVRPRDSFYSYEAKYTKGKTEYLLNPDLTGEEYRACEEAAVRTHKYLSCEGVSRTDIILDKDRNAYVLEINTLPGLTELSLVPMIAKNKGISFTELIEDILKDAIARK